MLAAIYRKFPLQTCTPYSKIPMRMSLMKVRSGSTDNVNKASSSQTTSKPAFEAPELTHAMIAAMNDARAKGLTMEQINIRSLEAMKGRGKFPKTPAPPAGA